jgi:uncharacterized protein (DUF4415 family)
MIEKKSTTMSGLDPNDDAPELTEEWFARGALYINGKLIRRGRPLGSGTRELVSLRIDKEALSAFKATGPGWQGRINDVLKRSAKRLAKSS